MTRDFYLAETEFNQGLWEEVIGSNPSDDNKGIGKNHPVNRVSWEDAVEFCNRLSQQEGLTPCCVPLPAIAIPSVVENSPYQEYLPEDTSSRLVPLSHLITVL